MLPDDGPPDAAAPVAAPDTPATQLRSLRFEQAGSRKFWQGSVSGDALRVTYGRIGNTGQTIVKQFESGERALRELNKLVDGKLRNGYLEQ